MPVQGTTDPHRGQVTPGEDRGDAVGTPWEPSWPPGRTSAEDMFCVLSEFGYNGSSLGTGLTAGTRKADARHPDSKGSWLVLRRQAGTEQGNQLSPGQAGSAGILTPTAPFEPLKFKGSIL